MKPISPEVRNIIENYAKENNGTIYAPILHPEYSDLPSSHGPERFDMIRPYLGHEGGTVVDIGSHWGYMAHLLEDAGYRVTAIEHADDLFQVLKGLRDACEKNFEVIHASVFDVKPFKYDIAIALNIFHHFLKKKFRYDQFLPFLKRLDCKTMIFQSHRAEEPQMRGSYLNFSPDEFADFISDKTKLKNVEKIGIYNRRQIYRLT